MLSKSATGMFLLLLLSADLILSGCHHADAVRDHTLYFDPIYNRADSMDPSDKELAFAYLDSVYKAFPEAGPRDLYRKYDYSRHYYFETLQDYRRALVYADSGLAALEPYANDLPFMKDYGRALFFKGDILMEEGKYSQAFLDFYQGELVIGKTRDTCLLGEFSDRLGLAYYRQGKYPEAIGSFRQSFFYQALCTANYADTFIGFASRQGLLDNIALSYAKVSRQDSAQFYYDSALSFIRTNEKQYQGSGSQQRYIETARGVIYGNMADLLLVTGDSAAAESLYWQSIHINLLKEHANEDAGFTLAKLTRLYLVERRFDSVRHTLQQIKDLLGSMPFKSIEAKWLQLKAQYADSMGHPAEAYTWYKGYISLRDSLAARNKPVDVNAELQNIAHEYELNLLKESNKTKTIYLLIAILFSVMALIIIGQVWLNWSRSKRNVARLTQLNGYILLQNDHMQKALSSLEESQQDNTRIIRVVAHDLRSPIGGIDSMMTLILGKKDLAPDIRKMLELVSASSRSSLALINDLLHAHAASADMTTEPVDMSAMLRYCVDLLQFKADIKQQRILLKTLPVTIAVNREKMWRVMSNLITNAIKFSPRGKDILVGMETTAGNLHIWVKDQGIGIPADSIDSLFDPQAAIKREGTAGEESFGLGLGISKQIVTAHRGTIWCESEPGRETTFYVELPHTPVVRSLLPSW